MHLMVWLGLWLNTDYFGNPWFKLKHLIILQLWLKNGFNGIIGFSDFNLDI